MAWSILIADDEAEYVRIQKLCMEKDDRFTVHTAHNGREALDVIERETVDMMCLDLTMPEMDGIELLLELHNRHIWFPVLILTGRRMDERIRPDREYGIVEFLDKPVGFRELKEKIESILNAREKRDVFYGLSLTTMLEVLEMERKTGVLTIDLEKGEGRIYFREGVVMDMVVNGLSGEEAMRECLKPANRKRDIKLEYVEHGKANRLDLWLTEIK